MSVTEDFFQNIYKLIEKTDKNDITVSKIDNNSGYSDWTCTIDNFTFTVGRYISLERFLSIWIDSNPVGEISGSEFQKELTTLEDKLYLIYSAKKDAEKKEKMNSIMNTVNEFLNKKIVDKMMK